VRERSALGIRYYVFDSRDWKALTYSRALVDFLVVAGGEGDALDDFVDIFRNAQLRACTLNPGLLRGDGDPLFDRCRIVRADFGPDAVL